MISYLLAVLAAAANASSSVLQRKADRDEPDEVSLHLRLILDLLHRPVWFAGILSVIVGFVCQAGALSRSPLAVIEPILVLELPFTLALGAIVFHRRIRGRDWVAGAAMTGGLALLIVSLSPRGGSAAQVTGIEWVLGIAVSVAVIAGLVGRGRRHRGQGRAAYFGAATGAAFGLTAALMTAMSEVFARNFAAIFTTWQTYAMVATGALAMYLLQNALQAGTLVAAQPGITLSNPVVSITWGVILFHERVNVGPLLAGAIVGAGLIWWGTMRLSRSWVTEPRLETTPG